MLAGYFVWQYADRKAKKSVTKFTMRHVVAVLSIVSFALAGLVLAFYLRAINIL